MNRTFFFGLIAGGIGFVAGAAYRTYLAATGDCSGALGIVGGGACSNQDLWLAFLNVFALGTLAMCVAFALASRRFGREDEGIVDIGDTFLAIGVIVCLSEVVVFSIFDSYISSAYGVIAVSLTLFGLKQKRQISMVVSLVLGTFGLTWAAADPAGLILGGTLGLFWVIAGFSYLASIKLGESLVGDQA